MMFNRSSMTSKYPQAGIVQHLNSPCRPKHQQLSLALTRRSASRNSTSQIERARLFRRRVVRNRNHGPVSCHMSTSTQPLHLGRRRPGISMCNGRRLTIYWIRRPSPPGHAIFLILELPGDLRRLPGPQHSPSLLYHLNHHQHRPRSSPPASQDHDIPRVLACLLKYRRSIGLSFPRKQLHPSRIKSKAPV